MKTSPDTALDLRGITAIASRYAAVIFATALGAAVFRAIVNRLFSAPLDRQLLGSFLFAAILGILWFTFALTCVFRTMRQENRSARQNEPGNRASGWKSLARVLLLSFGIAFVLSLTASLALELNDEILESRELPWIMPLITVQHYGFSAASRLFPCRAEGSDTGCEAYKKMPAFLAANTFAYFPFVLCVALCSRFVERFGPLVQTGARRFVRWSVPLAVLGLWALLVLNRLGLATYNTLYPTGDSHRHFGSWELVNDVTGTLIVAGGLFLPFYFYRAFRKSESLLEKRRTLLDLTSLAAMMVVALVLGDAH